MTNLINIEKNGKNKIISKRKIFGMSKKTNNIANERIPNCLKKVEKGKTLS